jgi:hypothetical protein
MTIGVEKLRLRLLDIAGFSRAPRTSALEGIADELTEAEHVADVP